MNNHEEAFRSRPRHNVTSVGGFLEIGSIATAAELSSIPGAEEEMTA